MTKRTVEVNLIAQTNNYLAGMRQAGQATRELGTAAEKLQKQGQAFDIVGRSAFAFGAIAVAAVGVAVKKFADFDQAMSNVQAATQESAANMSLLRDAALQAGADTVFSATEAASAIEELGKNGLSTAQIIGGGLSGALGLATAGQLDVGRAAEIAAISMKQFGLAGSDVPHIADLLAAGAGKAAGDVEDLAQALAQAGLVANQTGLSIDETTGLLAAFADKGLIGSDAGTSLKTMLQALTPSSKEAAAKIKELGISAFDTSGEFIGITKWAGIYEGALKKQSTEQQAATNKLIFGSDAVRAANVIYDLGADGVKKYVDQTNDAGYAAKVAGDRLNNLSGDLEKLGGSIDTALIKSGSGANDMLRSLTQTATQAVDAIGDLPQPVLDAGTAVTTILGAVGLLGGAVGTAVPRIAAFKDALGDLGLSGKKVAGGIGIAGAAIGAYVYFLSAAIAKQAEMEATGDNLVASLDKQTGAFTSYSREIVAKKLQDDGAAAQAKKYGIALDVLTDAALGNSVALKKYQDARNAYTDADSFRELDFAIGDTDRSVFGLIEQTRAAPAAFKELQAAAGTATEETTSGLDDVSAAAADATGQIDELAKKIADFGKVGLETRASNRAFEASIDDANAAAKKNGKTLDANTEKGRANQAALDAIASSANGVAAAKFKETGDMEASNKSLERGREKYVRVAEKMGATRREAEKLADKLIAMPETTTVEFKEKGLDTVKRGLNYVLAKDGTNVRVNLGYTESGRPRNKGEFSSGGFTGSIGRKNVAGLVHGEEFVSDADTTADPANRRVLEWMHAGNSMRDYMKATPAPVYVAAPTGSGAGAGTTIVQNYNFDNFREMSIAEATRQTHQVSTATLGLPA